MNKLLNARKRDGGRRLARFNRCRRGGVAVSFALLAVPLTCASLGAVDYARIVSIKVRLQDALDASTLAVGRSTVTTDQAAQSLGSAMLGANLKPYAGAQLAASNFSLGPNKVVSSASISVTPIVAGIFTGGNVTVGATSEVMRSVNKLEVAMVLDNTGSMSGSKISLLKTAASNFVDTLSAAAARSSDPDAVKIALVPFSMTVNVGSGYKTSSWIDQTGSAPINDQTFSAHVNRFTLFQTLGVNWAGCVESRQAPYDVQDTAPSTSAPATLFTPYFAPDEPDTNGFYNSYRSDTSNSSSWSVRQAVATKYNGAPTHTGANAVGYQYGPNSGCQLTPLVRLTTNWSGLKTSINSMYAIGDTNIPMGMVWGWHVLSPNAPFADGVAYSTPKTTKVVVMMTDGQNANAVTSNGDASIYSGIGYIWQNRIGVTSGTGVQRQGALDARLTTLCTNMKAQGIVIYTVRVEVNDANYAVLQSCASSPDKFYDVQDASQLSSVFNAIAGAIENLRLSA